MELTATLKRVSTLRARLLLDQPFFGMLALRLKLIEDPTPNATAWTDGVHMAFGPGFVAQQSDDALMGLIAHEVMHCACGHPWRRDARDQQTWNIAADHAINNVLTDAGFDLPDGGCCDPAFKGRNAEWIYDRIPKNDDSNDGSGPGEVRDAPNGDDPSMGDDDPNGQLADSNSDSNSDSGSDTQPTEADWSSALQQALAVAKGNLPAGAIESIGAAARAAADWRSLLQRFITDVAASDYTWTRPNARYLSSALYLPSLQAPDCGPIVFAIDTSGSIDTVLLEQFTSELIECVRTVRPREVHVIQCDTKVHRVETFQRGEDVTLTDIVGRGGTAFSPVFEHIAKEDVNPACCVYLTDMDGSFPSEHPDYPVLWAAYNSRGKVAPFGETVQCD